MTARRASGGRAGDLRRDLPAEPASELDEVVRLLAARSGFWTTLANRLGPDERTRVAGGPGWEAWLAAGADGMVRLEVRSRAGDVRRWAS